MIEGRCSSLPGSCICLNASGLNAPELSKELEPEWPTCLAEIEGWQFVKVCFFWHHILIFQLLNIGMQNCNISHPKCICRHTWFMSNSPRYVNYFYDEKFIFSYNFTQQIFMSVSESPLQPEVCVVQEAVAVQHIHTSFTLIYASLHFCPQVHTAPILHLIQGWISG